jgi:hypothetical protein
MSDQMIMCHELPLYVHIASTNKTNFGKGLEVAI